MAAKPKKTVSKRPRGVQPPSQSAAAPERAKETKKTFGKAAPRQVRQATATPSRADGRRATDRPSLMGRIGNVIRSVTSMFGGGVKSPPRSK